MNAIAQPAPKHHKRPTAQRGFTIRLVLELSAVTERSSTNPFSRQHHPQQHKCDLKGKIPFNRLPIDKLGQGRWQFVSPRGNIAGWATGVVAEEYEGEDEERAAEGDEESAGGSEEFILGCLWVESGLGGGFGGGHGGGDGGVFEAVNAEICVFAMAAVGNSRVDPAQSIYHKVSATRFRKPSLQSFLQKQFTLYATGRGQRVFKALVRYSVCGSRHIPDSRMLSSSSPTLQKSTTFSPSQQHR